MDYQVLFNWASGALSTAALIVVTLVISLLRGLFVDLTTFREEVAKEYLRKDDFHRVADRIFTKLDTINNKIDWKPGK
jgi:ABC-type enterochelin transport system permease subunit